MNLFASGRNIKWKVEGRVQPITVAQVLPQYVGPLVGTEADLAEMIVTAPQVREALLKITETISELPDAPTEELIERLRGLREEALALLGRADVR